MLPALQEFKNACRNLISSAESGWGKGRQGKQLTAQQEQVVAGSVYSNEFKSGDRDAAMLR